MTEEFLFPLIKLPTLAKFSQKAANLWPYLEQRFLQEEFAQNAAARPDVDGGAVPLLPQEKLGRTVPQGDHFIRVGTLLVLGL